MEAAAMATGHVFVLDGPAAVGKTTFVHRLLEDRALNLHYCPRLTTRERRDYDAHQRDYDFIDKAEFDRMVGAEEFAAYRVFLYGASYGLPRKPIEEHLAKGENVLAIVDLGTAEQVKQVFGEQAVTVFLISPVEQIEKRLKARGDDPKRIGEKVQNAANSMSFAPYYDFVLPNRDGQQEQVYRQLRELIAERLGCPA